MNATQGNVHAQTAFELPIYANDTAWCLPGFFVLAALVIYMAHLSDSFGLAYAVRMGLDAQGRIRAGDEADAARVKRWRAFTRNTLFLFVPLICAIGWVAPSSTLIMGCTFLWLRWASALDPRIWPRMAYRIAPIRPDLLPALPVCEHLRSPPGTTLLWRPNKGPMKGTFCKRESSLSLPCMPNKEDSAIRIVDAAAQHALPFFNHVFAPLDGQRDRMHCRLKGAIGHAPKARRRRPRAQSSR